MALVRIRNLFYGVSSASAVYTSRLTKLAFISCLSITLAGCGPEPTKYSWDTPWTVELISGDVKAVLKAPFGAFLIHRGADIDYVTLTAKGLDSMSMQYHVESRLPYYVWENLPDKTEIDIHTYTNVRPTDQGNNYAVSKKKVYFDGRRDISKTRPELFAKEIGPVWNNEAVRYENFNTTWYVIEQRSELDGIVIHCSNSAFYCRLHGARATEMLGLESLSVPIADVENWRDYQELIQQKVRSAIVSVETIATD